MGGVWRKCCQETSRVTGDLPPHELAEVSEERMKIEQTFKDSKSLLAME